MGILPDPDDVDFLVEGPDNDPRSLQETTEFIKAYKARPEYPDVVRRAKQILAAHGIDPVTYGIDDPQALLDRWRRCAEELNRSPGPELGANAGPHPEDSSTSDDTAGRIEDLVARVDD